MQPPFIVPEAGRTRLAELEEVEVAAAEPPSFKSKQAREHGSFSLQWQGGARLLTRRYYIPTTGVAALGAGGPVVPSALAGGDIAVRPR